MISTFSQNHQHLQTIAYHLKGDIQVATQHLCERRILQCNSFYHHSLKMAFRFSKAFSRFLLHLHSLQNTNKFHLVVIHDWLLKKIMDQYVLWMYEQVLSLYHLQRMLPVSTSWYPRASSCNLQIQKPRINYLCKIGYPW